MTTTLRPYEKDGTFSERFPILYQQPGRRQKAEKVLRVLSAFYGGPLD